MNTDMTDSSSLRQVRELAGQPFGEHEEDDEPEGHPVVPQGKDLYRGFGPGRRVKVFEQVVHVRQVVTLPAGCLGDFAGQGRVPDGAATFDRNVGDLKID